MPRKSYLLTPHALARKGTATEPRYLRESEKLFKYTEELLKRLILWQAHGTITVMNKEQSPQLWSSGQHSLSIIIAKLSTGKLSRLKICYARWFVFFYWMFPQCLCHSPGVLENVLNFCKPLHDPLTHCKNTELPSGECQGQSGMGNSDLSVFSVSETVNRPLHVPNRTIWY